MATLVMFASPLLTIAADSPDGATVKVEAATHQKTDTIALDLRGGGGFIGRFSERR
jgi:hypothetical protein